jgi:ABC-2 type transport system ATP-binding protein
VFAAGRLAQALTSNRTAPYKPRMDEQFITGSTFWRDRKFPGVARIELPRGPAFHPGRDVFSAWGWKVGPPWGGLRFGLGTDALDGPATHDQTMSASASSPDRVQRAPGPVIEVSGLVKVYDAVRVVDNVDLRVAPGEVFGILGRNGAGKTTTVECLQGLRRPTAGRLRVLGLDPVTDRARLRRSIGSQLQEAALPDRLRVAEAVALFDRAARRDPVALLEPWGLAGHRRTAFADLSGGQRQRLFIVLALLNDPEVVFLDELTQGLDPAARRNVWEVIRQIRQRGTTVVLVSHFAEEIEALCDRVVVLSDGVVAAAGTPREITDTFARSTTTDFTAPPGFDAAVLRRLPGVTEVTRRGDRLVVEGTNAMVAPACAATLDDFGRGPTDLHVSHPTLDDALVNLIGGHDDHPVAARS